MHVRTNLPHKVNEALEIGSKSLDILLLDGV